MFTVKHCHGTDVIYAAKRVEYSPGLKDSMLGVEHVALHTDEGEPIIIAAGDVYVMNDRGATVSIYRMWKQAA